MTLTSPEIEHNLLAIWLRASRIDLEEGLVAYVRLHESLRYYADLYGIALPNIIGAFAALSPNNDYLGNMRSLVTLIEGRRNGLSVGECTISTYNACRDRAWRFLNGEDFLTVTKGLKTRNFYQNILDPSDPVPVTIDGHMVCVAWNKRMRMRAVVRQGFDYEQIADAARWVARVLGVLPHQVQAVLWFTWKRIHNVIYRPQLDAFSEGNQWGFRIDPSTIRPYAARHQRSEQSPLERREVDQHERVPDGAGARPSHLQLS